jgi:prophage tail gpP-like protein
VTDPYATDNPELDVLVFRIIPQSIPGDSPTSANSWFELRHFLSYEYDQDFLTPVDGWNFTVDQDELSAQELSSLTPGTFVEIYLDDVLQTSGYIDDVDIQGDRASGNIVRVEGRDWLSPAVDGHIDPQIRFSPNMTLLDVVTLALEPFGASTFVADNSANRNVITGQTKGAPTTKKGKPLKSFAIHELKPYENEGAFAFASRVTQRFGLWIWPASDGETVVVAAPDYDQAPIYQLLDKLDPSFTNHNNILGAKGAVSRREQPSMIFASGNGGGGADARSTLKGGIINPLVLAQFNDITAQYPTIQWTIPEVPEIFAAITTKPFPIIDTSLRPLYLRDRESKTQDELNAFLRRELSLRMRKAFSYTATIEGHRLGGSPIAFDTIMSVDDDRRNVHGNLWVLGRRYTKQAGASVTKTVITMILPGTLQF